MWYRSSHLTYYCLISYLQIKAHFLNAKIFLPVRRSCQSVRPLKKDYKHTSLCFLFSHLLVLSGIEVNNLGKLIFYKRNKLNLEDLKLRVCLYLYLSLFYSSIPFSQIIYIVYIYLSLFIPVNLSILYPRNLSGHLGLA